MCLTNERSKKTHIKYAFLQFTMVQGTKVMSKGTVNIRKFKIGKIFIHCLPLFLNKIFNIRKLNTILYITCLLETIVNYQSNYTSFISFHNLVIQ